jgi:hypothetical protein
MSNVVEFTRPVPPVEEIITITEHLFGGEAFVERRVVNRDGLGFVTVKDDCGRCVLLRGAAVQTEAIRDLVSAWIRGRNAGRAETAENREWWSHG